MPIDTTQELFSFGPITVSVECQANAVVMSAVVENESEDDSLQTFGEADDFGDFLQIVSPDTTFALELLRVQNNDIIDIDRGALGTSTGHYIGWDARSTGGVRDNVVDLAPFGENVDCIFTGTLNTFFLEPPEVTLAPLVVAV